jgi:hypothetical protein
MKISHKQKRTQKVSESTDSAPPNTFLGYCKILVQNNNNITVIITTTTTTAAAGTQGTVS